MQFLLTLRYQFLLNTLKIVLVYERSLRSTLHSLCYNKTKIIVEVLVNGPLNIPKISFILLLILPLFVVVVILNDLIPHLSLAMELKLLLPEDD